MSESLEREPHGRQGAALEPVKQAEPPKRKELHAGRFEVGVSGFRCVIWTYSLDEHEPIDVVLDRNAWRHVVAKSHPGAGQLVHIWNHDYSQFWCLAIHAVGVGWLEGSIIEQTKPPVVEELPEDLPLAAAWAGGDREKGGWRVIRKDDKQVLQKHFFSKGDAQKWLIDHLARMKN